MFPGERVLVARHSPYNKILLTEDQAGLRTLRFGDEGVACQSVVKLGDPDHLELPYANVLPVCLAFMPQPRRALIIGLGGGTIPSFFHRRLPEMEIDVVEIDEVVVEVAKAYCGFSEDEKLRVHVDDGRDFIEKCSHRYDLIILDSFDAKSIPEHLATAEFLQSVRAALSPDGIVVSNVWGRTVNRQYDHMLLTYRDVFEEVYICDVPAPGTKIFISLPCKQAAMTREELLRRASAVSRQRGFRYDIGAVISGFRNSEEERVRGGEILRD